MSALRSIRVRFTAWYLIVLAILLAAMSAGLHSFLSFTLRRDLDRVLVHRVAQISGVRGIREIVNEGRFEEMLGEIVGFYTRDGEGYAVVSTRQVEESLNSDWIESAFRGVPVHVTLDSPTGQSLRFYIALFRPLGPQAHLEGVVGDARPPAAPLSPGQLLPERIEGDPPDPAVIVVAQPMDSMVSALGALRTILLVAVPLTLLLSAWGGLFLVRRALEPIDRMVGTTREIEETDLSGRVDVSTSDELGRLGRTLNAMLDRLERAFRRQRQFTDDASHELRAPLAVIEAEATLALRRERSPEDYRDALAIVAEEAGEMNRLIDRLLTLARSDAGADSRAFAPLDLASIARETVVALNPVADERGVCLTGPEDANVDIYGDVGGLRRVVSNLLDNAIRHTPKGGRVSIALAAEAGGVILAVTDTGDGIPPEHLPHIFERFYRVDVARSRADGGSGLGLAICRAIVESHGGTIEAESELGVGSSFVVRLPRLRAPTADGT